MHDYPPWTQAPAHLRALDGNCGLISVWLTAASLGIRMDEKEILKCCRFREGEPTFLVCIAVGLRDFGLRVEFRTDPDPAVQPAEALCSADAQSRDISVLPALSLDALFDNAGTAGRLILAYEGDNGDGHFSPACRVDADTIWLPYDNPAFISVPELENRRAHAGNCRQSLTVFVR